MIRLIHLSIILLAIFFLFGCTKGLIYTHTVRPLDVSHHQTRVGENSEEGDIRHIQYYVSVTWSSNAIGDIAAREGLETLYYADLEILNVLGIWRQFTVHVYGK